MSASAAATQAAPGKRVRQKAGLSRAILDQGWSLFKEQLAYKLEWLSALTDYLRKELAHHPRLVLAGDFNIAPEERDAHPDWKEDLLVSPPEREAFCSLRALGLEDAFRHFE